MYKRQIQKLSKNRGISAIVNTHYPEHALKISDNALLLNQDGTNIFGDAAEVINVENMRHSFSVQVHINQFSVDGDVYKRQEAACPWTHGASGAYHHEIHYLRKRTDQEVGV